MCVHNRILFICTGNYYRSRFAEAVFNHHAKLQQVPWTAFSRGLAVHLAEGSLSQFTLDALGERKVELRHTAMGRQQLCEIDLLQSHRQIALDRAEHFAMMQQQFPNWADKIEYWDVPDLLFESHLRALPEIERRTLQLLKEVSI
jgi:low molecular weight protein-tyrosine phosphatase